MCGIFGNINDPNAIKNILQSMKKIEYRGKDALGIFFETSIFTATSLNILKKTINNHQITITTTLPSIQTITKKQKNILETQETLKNPEIVLGHLLHAIIDFIPQPIKSKITSNILVANCEIYNWKELNRQNLFQTNNDVQTLLSMLEKPYPTTLEYNPNKIENKNHILKTLEQLDGPYAFAFLNTQTNQIILARDILGIKPLWYTFNNSTKQLNFASEKKALKTTKSNPAIELNPREILFFNTKTHKFNLIKREFSFKNYENEITSQYKQIKQETKKLLIQAIKKRATKNQKIGLLFSGGIDSTFIAYTLKQLNIDFTCYTAKVEGGNIQEAQDLIYAKEIAKKYKFKLKIAKISTNELEKQIKIVKKLIESDEYLKISVAMPFYFACKLAKIDKIKIMFSGLGSEEIFAGYRRHRKVENINLECFKGLTCLHERDLYRDDTITMKNQMEIRLPFLDKNLINYAMKIPDKHKLSKDKLRSKIILREIAKEMGLDKKYAERHKQAAQYGSKFDKGLLRLAKNKNQGKQEYIKNL